CRQTPNGIVNQVWEDSGDSHYHDDGVVLDPTRPFAPVAVQGFAYDALRHAADLMDRRNGHTPGPASDLRQRAATLRAQTLASFWQADLGTFAQALTVESDGTLRPARVVASSPGHLLLSGLLDGSDAAPVRTTLMARFRDADLLSAAGVRTKS